MGRPETKIQREVTSPKSGTFRRNRNDGLALTLIICCAAWLVDVTALTIESGGEHTWTHLRGVTAAFFFSGLTAVLAGSIVGLTWAIALDGELGRIRIARTRHVGWSILWHADSEHDRKHIHQCNALLLTSATFGGVSYLLTHHLILDFAQPHFGALAIVATHLVLVPLSVPIYSFFLGLFHQLVGSMLPRIRLGTWLLLICGVLTTTAVALVSSFWSVLLFLPWDIFGRIAATGMVGTIIGFLWFRGARPNSVPNPLCWALLVVWLASGAWGTGVPHDAQEDRAIFETNVFVSYAGHAALKWITDSDNDGFAPFFGGGDCAPFDPSVHPGAMDLPDNGIDEDCFAGDLSLDILDGTMDDVHQPVPESFPQRPHVVLITVDAFAARHLQSTGAATTRTPNLKRLAAEGVIFENCFSQGPSTRLSFPSLFTSMWDTEIKRKLVGKHPYPMLAENETLAETLKRAGYETHAVIPAPYFSKRTWKGLHQGFDAVHERPKKHFNKKTKPHNARHVTNAAVSVLKKKRTKPLFLWSHYLDAHAPHRWPPGIKRSGKGKEGKGKEAKYNAELTYIDKSLGRLFKEIDTRLGDNTLVIVTSDHGHGFDLPRHKKKGYGYDLNTVTLHVPLIVKGPKIKPARVTSLASTLDILPTVSNLIRVKPKANVRGSSLVSELFGQKHQRPQVLFHQMFLTEELWKNNEPLRMISVRTPTHNLVIDRKRSRVHLWNWQDDYFETEDLIGTRDGKTATLERGLRRLLSAFLYKTQPQLDEAETQASKGKEDQIQPKTKMRKRQKKARPEPFVGPTIIPPVGGLEMRTPPRLPAKPRPRAPK
jgi:arylsulfatase A-like enzyme